ncbi:MAG: methyltransferase domain-containing protein [Candidatus Moraniibacteriota bacterium]
MKKETAKKILQETEAGYDLISQKFSQTRKHFWRGLEFSSDYCKEDDNVLDFGCGNGRLLELLAEKSVQYYGVDVSQKLIELAKQKYPENTFSKINPSETRLEFEDNYFNAIFSIAVFHHFPSKKYRQEVARELYAKTKNGGRIIVTVWYLFQERYFKNILKNWFAKLQGKSQLDWNDCEISFTDNQGKKFQRFHHAFTKRELQKLFQEVGFEIEKCEIVNNRNILLVGRK